MSQPKPTPTVASRLVIRKALNGYVVEEYDHYRSPGDPGPLETAHVFESWGAASAYQAKRFGETAPVALFLTPEEAVELARDGV